MVADEMLFIYQDFIDASLSGSVNTGYIPDDARSHISQFSTRSRSRSLADGHAEHGLFGAGQGQRYPSRNGELSFT